MMEIETLLVVGLVVALALLLLRDLRRERDLSRREAELSRSIEIAARAELERWKLEHESRIRADAVQRSRAVVSGKTAEQLVPLLPGFPFDPRDARFLGSPVDLVVFDGMSAGELRHVVFVEVKTGASATLTPRERRVRDAVLEGRVRWHELRLDGVRRSTLPDGLFLPLRAQDGETVGQLEVVPSASEIRYWSDWTEPPLSYPLEPDLLVRLDERGYGLTLRTDGPRPHLRLDEDVRIEVDADGDRLEIRFGDESVEYGIDPGRVSPAKGGIVLLLDGGR